MDLPADSSPPPQVELSPLTFVIFGVIVIAIAAAIFFYATRCPCDKKQAAAPGDKSGDKNHTTTPPASMSQPFVSPSSSSLADLKSTVYVLAWDGATAPRDDLRVHFLLTAAPHSTFHCDAHALFGTHKRVRVTLPKGTYIVRAEFGKGGQAVVDNVPEGGMLTLTEATLMGQALTEPVAAADVQAGVCARGK